MIPFDWCMIELGTPSRRLCKRLRHCRLEARPMQGLPIAADRDCKGKTTSQTPGFTSGTGCRGPGCMQSCTRKRWQWHRRRGYRPQNDHGITGSVRTSPRLEHGRMWREAIKAASNPTLAAATCKHCYAWRKPLSDTVFPSSSEDSSTLL